MECKLYKQVNSYNSSVNKSRLEDNIGFVTMKRVMVQVVFQWECWVQELPEKKIVKGIHQYSYFRHQGRRVLELPRIFLSRY